MLSNLKNYQVILGSGSPRRHELLQKLGIPFSIRRSPIDEIIPAGYDVMRAAVYLAELKATDLSRSLTDDELLITADTVVLADGKILGKPASRQEAISTLLALSGKKHLVITGVCIMTNSFQRSFDEITEVTFANVSEQEATWYIDHHEVMDKAGSYGIQDWIGLTKVTHISGSYYNIMGLPMHRLYQELCTISQRQSAS